MQSLAVSSGADAGPGCSGGQDGFSLIELLVVILIIGILAAIAIPAFLNQKAKAGDAVAKVQARTAQTAAATYGTDHNGEYEGMELKSLQEIESALKDEASAKLTVPKATKTEYEVVSTSASTGDTFAIKRNAEGVVERTCKTPTKKPAGGCLVSGGSW